MNPRTLETKYPSVYAIGDVANTGTPKAGVFAEGAAKAVASACDIEFGGERVGRVDVDFFSGPKPTGVYYEPSLAQRADRNAFGATRKAR